MYITNEVLYRLSYNSLSKFNQLVFYNTFTGNATKDC
jgi:hypothetical protein